MIEHNPNYKTNVEGLVHELIMTYDPESWENMEIREGMRDTPRRVMNAMTEATSGYEMEVGLTTFENQGSDQLVVVEAIPFYSNCEHHMMPFFGTATVGYIPGERIVGLSKINRLVRKYSRRWQVQERMTQQILDELVRALKPVGAGVIVAARHMCMESRGVCDRGQVTHTSALHGVLRTDEAARAEFMALRNKTEVI